MCGVCIDVFEEEEEGDEEEEEEEQEEEELMMERAKNQDGKARSGKIANDVDIVSLTLKPRRTQISLATPNQVDWQNLPHTLTRS